MVQPSFDRNAQKATQLTLISSIAVGYVFAVPSLLWLAAGALALAAFAPAYAPQLLLYRLLVRRTVLRTDRVAEDSAPHRFAQLVGLSVLGVALVALLLGASTLAWSAALLVLFLAVVNVTTGFCAGCFMYAQLARIRGGAR